ncbi:SpoIIE family protein phosphatase [Cellulomonas sp. P22]|uniref:SpoIIE family protein phosphatase n=1 Tax=Cellulomonas sp. P22 TaxID=3373189 RepID=UPI0037944DB5
MVNPARSDHHDESLAGLRDRALRAADVPCFVASDEDGERRIVWVNDAFTRVTGFSLEDVQGQGPDVLYGPWTDRAQTSLLRDAVDAGVVATGTVQARRADGSAFWTRVSLSPVRDDDGATTHWVAVLVDVTELIERDAAQTALVESERIERTSLRLVLQISDLLMDLDDPTTLREIARLLEAGGVVAWAGFYLNDGGLSAADGIDVTAPPSGRGRRHGNVPPDDVPTARRRDLVDEVQQLLDGVTDNPVELDLTGWHATTSASGWLADHVRPRIAEVAPGLTRVVVLPVPGRRRVMGVLVVVPRAGSGRGCDQLDESSRTVLQLTVRRVGLAVDNVRLYEREHRLAETLQRSMLPEQAEVEGLDVWTYYAPNAEHAQVGGDWYDVLQVSTDVVGVVIGDVVGHDVEAAAAMGQLRSVVRSYAYEVVTPGPVLERVDQLVAGMRIPRSAALVLTTLTRNGDGWDVEYSRAGHLPALLARQGRVTRLADGAGPLIGFGGRERTTGRAEIVPGDVLVFYTDGLIERRDRALREGVETLVDVVAGITATDSAGIGEELLSRLADSPEDDVAVVVVRVPDPSDATALAGSPRSRRWLLPSEPASIGRARHAVLRTCQTWGLPDGPSAELVVSELVANAVLHGWGHIALRLYDTGEGLRIEVEDSNPTPPVATDGHPGRIGGYGMQIVDRLADWGWRPARGGKLVWAKLRADGTDRVRG